MKIVKWIAILVATMLCGACAPEVRTARTYELAETGISSTLASCTVHSAEAIVVNVPGEFSKEGGALVGALIGGLVGAAVDVADGDEDIGAGTYAGAAAGAVLGGAAGLALETREVPGVRYVYRTAGEERLQAVVFPLRAEEAILPAGSACLVETYPYEPYCYRRTGDAARCGAGRNRHWARLLPLEDRRVASPPALEYTP